MKQEKSKGYVRKGLEFLVRNARTIVIPLVIAGALYSGGCFSKKDSNDTTSGSSGTPAYNYGVIVKDFDGNPIPNAKVSLYDAEVYNTDDGTGDMATLVPKDSGYYTTDANGEAKFNLDEREHHIVAWIQPANATLNLLLHILFSPSRKTSIGFL